jgi:hypothetical protein
MENLYSSATSSQACKTAEDAQKLGSAVKKDFEDAVKRGKDVAAGVAEGTKDAAATLSDRARAFADGARRNLGKTAGKVSDYADANTALVTVAAFGIGLLMGHLVTRES